MRRFRFTAAVLGAVALLWVLAACTPQQQVQAGTGIGSLITLILFIIAESMAPPR